MGTCVKHKQNKFFIQLSPYKKLVGLNMALPNVVPHITG